MTQDTPNPVDLADQLLRDFDTQSRTVAEDRVAECVKNNDPKGAMIWLEVWSLVTGQR